MFQLYIGAGNPDYGTGGALIVFGNILQGVGQMSSFGAVTLAWAGSSGGGSVNVFYKSLDVSSEISMDASGTWKTVEQYAGNWIWACSRTTSGYNGGFGTCTMGSISSGYFVND